MNTVEPTPQKVNQYYGLNFNATKNLWNKASAENCMANIALKIAVAIPAYILAIGETILNAALAVANGAIYAANGVKSYFADKTVTEETKPEEKPAQVEAAPVAALPAPVAALPAPVAAPVAALPAPVAASTKKAVPYLPTGMEAAKAKAYSLGSQAISGIGYGLSKLGSFVYTITYPVRHAEDFAIDTAKVVRHPVASYNNAKTALSTWYNGPKTVDAPVAAQGA